MKKLTKEQRKKLDRAQQILDYKFDDETLLLHAITHPSAVEGLPVRFSYERLEFLGDSILGSIVANEAFHRFGTIDEGGLTRIKVALVSGQCLSKVADGLGYSDIIIFGESERGTNGRGLHSALENVYESVLAAMYLDGGLELARQFVARTLFPLMNVELAKEPESPKSMLQEKLQGEGLSPTYKLIQTQGPPHDRTFVTQVFAGVKALARGVGRSKKESETRAAREALQAIDAGKLAEEEKAAKQDKAHYKAEKAHQRAVRRAEKREEREHQKMEKKEREAAMREQRNVRE